MNQNPFLPRKGQIVPLGRVEGEGEVVYRATPAITRSMFLDFLPPWRPSYFCGRWVTGTIARPRAKNAAALQKAMDTGIAAHTFILEGDAAFDRIYIEKPNFKRSEAGKVAAVEWARANNQRKALPKPSMDRLRRLRESVRAHRVAGALLAAPGRAETTWRTRSEHALWQCRTDWFIDEATPELCAIVNDHFEQQVVRPGDAVPVNLKTCQTLSEESFGSFQREAVSLRYDVGEAFYRMVVQAVLGLQRPIAPEIFIAVEKQEPCECGVWIVDADDALAAWAQVTKAAEAMEQCLASGVWPGIPQDRVQRLQFPGWHRKRVRDGAGLTEEGGATP